MASNCIYARRAIKRRARIVYCDYRDFSPARENLTNWTHRRAAAYFRDVTTFLNTAAMELRRKNRRLSYFRLLGEK